MATLGNSPNTVVSIDYSYIATAGQTVITGSGISLSTFGVTGVTATQLSISATAANTVGWQTGGSVSLDARL